MISLQSFSSSSDSVEIVLIFSFPYEFYSFKKIMGFHPFRSTYFQMSLFSLIFFIVHSAWNFFSFYYFNDFTFILFYSKSMILFLILLLRNTILALLIATVWLLLICEPYSMPYLTLFYVGQKNLQDKYASTHVLWDYICF